MLPPLRQAIRPTVFVRSEIGDFCLILTQRRPGLDGLCDLSPKKFICVSEDPSLILGALQRQTGFRLFRRGLNKRDFHLDGV